MANLRFSNIDWEKEIIRLTQVKTGNPLELPLLEDVGEAIINYLKNVALQLRFPELFQSDPGGGTILEPHPGKTGWRVEAGASFRRRP